MTAAAERFLIVNADDFGQTHGINAGIIAAHQRGIVSSASLMVRWDAVDEACAYARANSDLSVGLHVDIGEWAIRDGSWVPLYEVAPRDNRELVMAEVARQLLKFRELLGRDPSHLDSHQHVHYVEPVRSILETLAGELDVPLRSCSEDVVYCDGFYGQTSSGAPIATAILPEGLIDMLSSLQPGVSEMGCHPGLGTDIDSMYRGERAIEVETLCDPRVRQALSDLHIQLVNFDSRPRLRPATANHECRT